MANKMIIKIVSASILTLLTSACIYTPVVDKSHVHTDCKLTTHRFSYKLGLAKYDNKTVAEDNDWWEDADDEPESSKPDKGNSKHSANHHKGNSKHSANHFNPLAAVCVGAVPEACLVLLAIPLTITAGSVIISESIVVVGNTVHWLEEQGSCDDSFTRKTAALFVDSLVATGGWVVTSARELTDWMNSYNDVAKNSEGK